MVVVARVCLGGVVTEEREVVVARRHRRTLGLGFWERRR